MDDVVVIYNPHFNYLQRFDLSHRPLTRSLEKEKPLLEATETELLEVGVI